MPPNPIRWPYVGDKTSIVIAIDVGTTFSGAAYTLLIPTQIPEAYSVNGFKGQEHKNESVKVPTVVYYDAQSRLLACGSERPKEFECSEEPEEHAEPTKVEWFKLSFCPNNLLPPAWETRLPEVDLPEGLTAVNVLGDFLRYMMCCVRDHLSRSRTDGKDLWKDTIGRALFVLTHPNGWGGHQQSQYRDAAVLGGLVPNTSAGHGRIQFVTEGEAAMNWCVKKGLAKSALSVGSHAIVVDAGGGTIDISCFRIAERQPLELVETDQAECILAGSVFVTTAFRSLVEEKLSGSKWSEDGSIERLEKEFETTEKGLFRDESEVVKFRLGVRKDQDSARGIRNGELRIPGREIARLFERACSETAAALKTVLQGKSNAHVFLVGGFGASPWLYQQLKERLLGLVTDVYQSESQSSKAVADGAISYHIDKFVTTRIAKRTYGAEMWTTYNPEIPSHRGRPIFKCEFTGKDKVYGAFSAIVTKGTSVKTKDIFRQSYIIYRSRREAIKYNDTLEIYSGSKTGIDFKDIDPNNFRVACTFSMTCPVTSLTQAIGPSGIYWVWDFDCIISVGTAELQCWIEWKENGVVKKEFANATWEDTD